MADFRDMRKQRQQQYQQGIVVPEDVYNILPQHSETVSQSPPTIPDPTDDHVIKTSFYPRLDQLDKLDDLVGEYNRKYRRQRKKIDRQVIIRYLIDQCDIETLDNLQT